MLELEGDGRPWLDITMSCAKTAEPIEMEFGGWTWVDPRNHVFGKIDCNARRAYRLAWL